MTGRVSPGTARPPVSVNPEAPALPGLLVAEIESVATFAKASRAHSTHRVYASCYHAVRVEATHCREHAC